MSLTTPVHTDLTGYRRRIGSYMTARTMACTAGAIASAVAVGAPLALVARAPSAAVELACAAVALPAWALGFWHPAGMDVEEWLPYGLRRILRRARLSYGARERLSAARPAGEARGGAWDVLQKEWETRGRRVGGCERWEPSALAGQGR